MVCCYMCICGYFKDATSDLLNFLVKETMNKMQTDINLNVCFVKQQNAFKNWTSTFQSQTFTLLEDYILHWSIITSDNEQLNKVYLM